MRRQEAEQNSAAAGSDARGGQGVHREMESEGLASNLRAVAEGESQANRSATSALIRACSLEAVRIDDRRPGSYSDIPDECPRNRVRYSVRHKGPRPRCSSNLRAEPQIGLICGSAGSTSR